MINLDYRDARPIYAQVIDTDRSQIAAGILQNGDKLPSVRDLASQLAINPNTVQKALGELDSLGIIISAPGRGMFVEEDATEKIRNRMSSKISEIQEISTALAKAGVDEETVLLAVREAYRASKS